MKNIKLIALIFLTFGRVNYISGENNITASSILQLNHKDNLDVSGGGKISIPNAAACFYKSENKINFAGNFCINNIIKNIQINVKLGNISYSGILSKLNNPALSDFISPLGNSSVNTSDITAVFPNLISFSNPVSYYGNINFNKKLKGTLSTSFSSYFVPDKIFCLSLYGKYKIHRQTFSFSQIAVNSPYKENIPSSWYSRNFITKKDYYYPAGKHTNLLNQLEYSNQNFSTLFTLGVFENIWKHSPALIYKSENKISSGATIISCSFYINPNIDFVLTNSEKKLENLIQFKFLLQKRFVLPFNTAAFLKAGSGFYFDSPVYYNTNLWIQNIKNSFGMQMILPVFRLTGILQIDSLIKQKNEPDINFGEGISVNMKVQWFLNKIQPDITGSFTYKKNETKNTFSTLEKIVFSVSFLENPKILVNSSLKITQKNLIHDSLEISASLSARYSWNKINFQIKAFEN